MKSDGSLPIGDRSVLLLWPEVSLSKGETLAEFLRSYGVEVSLLSLDDEVTADKVKGLGKDKILLGAYDLLKNPEITSLASSLGDSLVLLSMKTPYDVMACPGAGTVIACYGDRPETLRALAKALTGGVPQGELPVQIPGFFPSRWKLEGF